MTPRRRGHAAAALVVLSAAGMAWGALGSVALFVGSGLVGAAVVFWAWRGAEVTLGTVLLAAVLARLIVFPLPPTLSDDGYRYVWDGQLQVEGVNPYRYRPSDPLLADRQQGELYGRLNSPDFYSVYPPASQGVFALGGLVSDDWRVSWYAIKAVFVGFEALGLLLLARMVSPGALLLYAWHPLALFEIAGQGHTEGGVVGLLVLAAWGLAKGRGGLAGAALAGAGLFKLVPFVLLPFSLRQGGVRLLVGAIVVTAALAAPYAAPYVLPHVRESLDLYVRYFEWNAGPYFLLKHVAWFVVGEGMGSAIGLALRAAFLLGLPVLLWLQYHFRWSPSLAWYAVFTWFLATSTTVHPWYLLGVLVLLPLIVTRSKAGAWHVGAWHLLAAGSLATYLLYAYGSVFYDVAVTLGWMGWAGALAAGVGMQAVNPLLQIKKTKLWKSLRHHVKPQSRVLDLGAGEGYVGVAVAADGHSVLLADVVDLNRTALPWVQTNGRELPFGNDAFDATLLAYVLHHAEDPEAVLREARRVTSGRVIVVESVLETTWDRRWLPFADRLTNRLRGEGQMREQEAHLHFRSTADWRDLFVRLGFEVVLEERRGNALHRQRVFVLECAAQPE